MSPDEYRTGPVVWAVASSTYPGEVHSGDRSVVAVVPSGALLAVVDGLGHGEEAFTAASVAIDTIRAAPESGLIALVTACHQALASTRGAVMTIASISEWGVMEWVGIGNVEGLMVRPAPGDQHEGLIQRAGIVGQEPLPSLHPRTVALCQGDLVILATDGIRSSFTQTVEATDPPAVIASHVLTRCASGHDDALVLVARYEDAGT